MYRAYEVKPHLNKAKERKVRALFKPYRQAAKAIGKRQWRQFFEKDGFNKHASLKGIESPLSERYKETVQYQVVGVLKSFISNRANDFFRHVVNSSLPPETKARLLYLNAAQAWYDKSFTIDEQEVPQGELKVARVIMRHVLSRHHQPNLTRINLVLDAKVAQVTPRIFEQQRPAYIDPETGKRVRAGPSTHLRQARKFGYWLHLVTLQSGKPIWVPLEDNGYFQSIPGSLANSIQINLDRDGDLHFMLVKDVPEQKGLYQALTEVLPLDFGLRTLFATPDGGLFGYNFIDQLRFYDEIISSIARERLKQGLRVRSRRYDHWVEKMRAYLKNEINRVLNRLIKLYGPKKIIVEHLDFRSPHLSRRMNRLISNCGRRIVRDKLQSLHEQYGIEIEEINAAYTSQECSECHYVAKNNRPQQAVFDCKFCGLHLHADVNSARTHVARSSCEDVKNVSLSQQKVLQLLTEQFVSKLERDPGDGRPGRLHSRARTLLQSNPYFAGYFKEEASPQKMVCS